MCGMCDTPIFYSKHVPVGLIVKTSLSHLCTFALSITPFSLFARPQPQGLLECCTVGPIYKQTNVPILKTLGNLSSTTFFV